MPFAQSKGRSLRWRARSKWGRQTEGLNVPHLVIAVTPDSEVILRSNVSPDVLRSFAQDLIDVADEIEETTDSGGTTH